MGMTNNLKYDPQALSQALKQLLYGRHGNFRDAARNLDVLKNTLQRAMENGTVVHHSLSLKLALTEQNELHGFCVDEILPNGLFKDMLDRVHLDEKWFLCDTVSKTILLAADEDLPYRATKH